MSKKKRKSNNERTYKGKKIITGIWKKRQVDYVYNEIIIKMKLGKDRDNASMDKLFSGRLAKANVIREFDRFSLGVLEVPDDVDILEVIAELRENPDIDYAEPNMIDKESTTIPNDTHYGLQWALPTIRAPEAWDIETGSNQVLIAILDSGIPMDGTPPSLSHPDLNDPIRIILGHDYENDDDIPRDDRGHGTHVAGIAASISNNANGIAGLNWGSRLYIVKVFDQWGSGSHSNFYDGVIEAVDYAVTNNLKLVINYSGGGSDSETKENAIIYARDRGCLIVAAAGNDYGGSVDYPAAYSASYDNVIAVSATDSLDHWANFSSAGPEVCVCAPGDHIYSTMPNYAVTLNDPPGNHNQDYDYMDGTSMSSPYVAGLAALLWSCNDNYSAEEIRHKIEEKADDLGDPMYDEYYGYGRIDAYETLLTCSVCSNIMEPGQVGARARNWRLVPIECVLHCVREDPCIFRHEVVHCYYDLEPHPRCKFISETGPECKAPETFAGCIGLERGCPLDDPIPYRDPGRYYRERQYSTPSRRIIPRKRHVRTLTKKRPLRHKKRYYPKK